MIVWTRAELAVLTVVGETAYKQGACDLLNGEIAKRAGVSRSVVQRTIKDAAATGLVSVESLRGSILHSNRVKIVSKWRNWLASTYGTREKVKTDMIEPLVW